MGQQKRFQQAGIGANKSQNKVRTSRPYTAGHSKLNANRYASGKSMYNLSYQLKKERQEKFKNHKSAALREYAKLCKREGIESERVNLGPRV